MKWKLIHVPDILFSSLQGRFLILGQHLVAQPFILS